MADDNGQATRVGKRAPELLRWLPPEMVREILSRWRALNRAMASEWSSAFYEVGEYSVEVAIQDVQGRKATITRREEITSLVNSLRAFQDVLWGDGDIVRRYESNLGEPVDRIEVEGRRHLLLWLDRPLVRGSATNIETRQTVLDMFRHRKEWHETVIRHRTERVNGAIVFPKNRGPIWAQVTLERALGSKPKKLSHRLVLASSDGWKLSWRAVFPEIGSRIRVEWLW